MWWLDFQSQFICLCSSTLGLAVYRRQWTSYWSHIQVKLILKSPPHLSVLILVSSNSTSLSTKLYCFFGQCIAEITAAYRPKARWKSQNFCVDDCFSIDLHLIPWCSDFEGIPLINPKIDKRLQAFEIKLYLTWN